MFGADRGPNALVVTGAIYAVCRQVRPDEDLGPRGRGGGLGRSVRRLFWRQAAQDFGGFSAPLQIDQGAGFVQLGLSVLRGPGQIFIQPVQGWLQISQP
jgi:hypothetical protein